MRTKAYRRHQDRRHQKRRVTEHLQYCDCLEKNPMNVHMMKNTPHRCSRACCGNPRRWFKDGLTIQEKRFLDNWLDFLREGE